MMVSVIKIITLHLDNNAGLKACEMLDYHMTLIL
jgi:hypothetical protein